MSTSPLAPLRNTIPFSDSNFSFGDGDDLVSDSNFLSVEGNDLVSEPFIAYARELRKNQTKAEEVLWNLLRNRQLDGFKFRRQHPVSPLYILDFFCSKVKLAVELDGDHHDGKTQQEYDVE